VSRPIPVDLDKAQAFREPWQAKAFAFVVQLHRAGHFTWDDWVRTLAEEIAAFPQRADEDAELAYHRQFLTALEKIVANRGMTTPEAMQARKLAWRQAYLATPHGLPVDLAAGEDSHSNDDHDGDHDHVHRHGHDLMPRRTPIAVHPARRVR
jgi:nitrile hydratase accessory protein